MRDADAPTDDRHSKNFGREDIAEALRSRVKFYSLTPGFASWRRGRSIRVGQLPRVSPARTLLIQR